MDRKSLRNLQRRGGPLEKRRGLRPESGRESERNEREREKPKYHEANLSSCPRCEIRAESPIFAIGLKKL